jgi:hypothetical protein
MRLYPTMPRPRARTIGGDVALVLLLVVFAWLGARVHDSIAELGALGRGVRDAGATIQSSGRDAATGVRSGVGSAADQAARVPLVGDEVSDALRSGGDEAARAIEEPAVRAGGEIAASGRAGEQQALRTARLVGWVMFLVPAILLLSRTLPGRVQQVRTLTAAQGVLGHGADPERVRALAHRAVFSLPYATLARHSDDPVGDLLRGRYEPLLAAVSEDAGLRVDRHDEPGGRVPRTAGEEAIRELPGSAVRRSGSAVRLRPDR